ncbi:MAG: hypothetical protein F4154_01200 [Candidatus Dadabacteria bacterium]|nr:hypothetical protein [Candidatus Dadabacteria bacterium]
MKDLNSASTYIDSRDEDGSTLLHIASLACNLESVKLFIAAGADVNAVDKSGFTPLHDAIREGISEITRNADEGDPEARKNLAVMIAEDVDPKIAREGNMEAVKLFIAAGADVNARDGSGGTPLHYTWRQGKTEAVKVLIAAGADINARDEAGQTPLYVAVGFQSFEAIKTLIAAGADVNAKDKYGYTPLDTGLRQGITADIVKILIAGGANVNSLSGVVYKSTPLHIAVSPVYQISPVTSHGRSSSDSAEILKTLIAAGADINVKDSDGKTPLHHAVVFNDPSIVKILVDAGADVYVKDKGGFFSSGKTPLQIARSKASAEVVKVLEAAEISM